MDQMPTTQDAGRRVARGVFSSALVFFAVAPLMIACGGGGAEASWSTENAGSSGAGGGGTNPPTAPTGLIAAPNGSFAINLAWQASADDVGVAAYHLDRCAGASCNSFVQVAAIAGTSYPDTGLSGGTNYRYRVRAIDGDQTYSPYSNIASAATAGGLVPPTAPTGLMATPNGSSAIDLAWLAATDDVGVAGYRVDRCQGAGCSAFAQIAMPAGTSFPDSGLNGGTSYSYRVRAIDTDQNLGPYSGVASATTGGSPPPPGDTTPPTAPANLVAAPDGPFGIALSWQASIDTVGVTGYRVERCQGSGCGSFAQVAAPSVTSLSDSGLLSATSYSYRVRATDAAANLSQYSSVASATTGTAPNPPPINLPTWVSNLAIGQWYEIPNTRLSSIEPSPTPPGITGPQSKIVAWTSFVVDPRNSMVYSIANGGHSDYGGNEVDRLELENDPPRWVARLASTPNGQIVEEQTHYNDGRPTSRHTYYGVTFNEAQDRFMLVGGARFGMQQGFGISTTDSYNISANTYSPAGSHPNLSPSGVASFLAFNTTSNPVTGDMYSFGNFFSAKWTRSTNTWAATGASGSAPYGQESMSAMDTTRSRIFILGGSNSDRHTLTLPPNAAANSFTQVSLSGANVGDVSGAQGAAMVYVAAIDRFLVRKGGSGGAVYQINPSTFAVTALPTTNGGSVPSTQNGPYNKFLYVPRLGGCIYVPSYSGNAWFLRVH